MVTILNRYALGDMDCCYFKDSESGNVELALIPAGMEPLAWEKKRQRVDSLIQIKKAGDAYPGGYAGGATLRESATTGARAAGQPTFWSGKRGAFIWSAARNLRTAGKRESLWSCSPASPWAGLPPLRSRTRRRVFWFTG